MDIVDSLVGFGTRFAKTIYDDSRVFLSVDFYICTYVGKEVKLFRSALYFYVHISVYNFEASHTLLESVYGSGATRDRESDRP